MNSKIVKEFTCCQILGTVFTFAAIRSLALPANLDVSMGLLLFLSFAFVLGFYLLFLNRRVCYAILIAFIVIAAVALINLYYNGFNVAWFGELTNVFSEISNLILYSIALSGEYDLVIAIGLAVFFSLISVMFIYNIPSLLALTAISLMVFILPNAVFGLKADTLSIMLALGCMLIFIITRTNLLARENTANADFVLRAIPLCAIVLFICWVLPKPSVSGQILDAKSIIESLSKMLDDVFFLGNSVTLGGDRSVDDEVVMEVQADNSVYLKGRTLETYTGSQWRTSDDGYTELLPLNDTLYSIGKGATTSVTADLEAGLTLYEGGANFRITPKTRLNCLYMPAGSSYFLLNKAETVNYDGMGSLRLNGSIEANEVYDVYYNAEQSSVTYNFDTEIYLQLPDSLPERVSDLALLITESCTTTYEKAIAIKSYLTSNYTYTMTPERTGAGYDFIDYFLFESKEGYCTYFASAFSVLARCAGIPTRYVEGYTMPSETNSDGLYIVTGENAHAWAEYYDEHKGWESIDATPGSAAPAQEIVTIESEGGEPTSEQTPAQTATNNTSKNNSANITVVIIIIILICAASAAVVPFMLKKRITKMTRRERIQHAFGEILKYSGRLGCPIEAGETAISFARRYDRSLRLHQSGVKLTEAAERYSQLVFDEVDIKESDIEALVQLAQRLKEYDRHVKLSRFNIFNIGA